MATSTEKISIVAVGKYRATAEGLVHLFSDSPFRLAAMLDAHEPEPFNFTQDRLRLVLRSLFPTPRCFMAGEAVPEEINKAAIEVWEEFIKEKGVENPLLINLREYEGKTVEETANIPKEELAARLINGALVEHFFPKKE